MTLFESIQNGKYETNHLHMVLNEHIDYGVHNGLIDDRKYGLFVHEYVHYYQHFATLYGSQFCKMANIIFIETINYLKNTDKIVIPFGIWEYNDKISNYRKFSNAVCGSKNCTHIVDDIDVDEREIKLASKEKRAVKIGVYDYSEDDAYEDGFTFGYYCIIESMAHIIQKLISPTVEHNQIPYEAVEIICRSYYPEIVNDPLQMVTICLCSLMYVNPGSGFFSVISFAKNHSDLRGVNFFKEFISTSYVKYKGKHYSMDYVGQIMLNEYKEVLEQICGCNLEYYNRVIDNFIKDYQIGICGLLLWLETCDVNNRKSFMKLIDIYGLPYIETPEMTFLPKNDQTGKIYLESAALAGFELLFRRLQKLDGDICPMYRVCKKGRFKNISNVDEFCGKEQWRKNCKCLMVKTLEYYGLKNKVFIA